MQDRVHAGGVSKSNQRSISDESGDSVIHIEDGKLMCWPRWRPMFPLDPHHPPKPPSKMPHNHQRLDMHLNCKATDQKKKERGHNLCPDYDGLFYSTSRHSCRESWRLRSVTIDLQMSKYGKNAPSLTTEEVWLPKCREMDARVWKDGLISATLLKAQI